MSKPHDSQSDAGSIPEAVLVELREAKQILEQQGLADRLTELIGTPITASLKLLPESAERLVYGAVDKSLQVALDLAVTTLGEGDPLAAKPRLWSHKFLAGL